MSSAESKLRKIHVFPNEDIYKTNIESVGENDLALIPIQNGHRIGEIVQSVIPLTDAGLHLLDGALLPAGGVYDGFVQYINRLFVSQNPPLKWLPKEQIVLPTFSANTQNGITISDARGNTTNLQNIFNGTSSSVQIGLWTTYWVNIDYAQDTLLTSYTIQADNNGNPEHPSAWVVNGSNDGETWETIDSQSSITFSLNESKTFTVNPEKVYRQYRIVFSDGVLNSNNGEIRKISFDAYSAIYGYENELFFTEEQWHDCVAKYGVCSKFVVSTSGVRLPKLYSETRYLVKSWKEGTEWYNLYSDGWVEQGGYHEYNPSAYGTDSVVFKIEFVDTNYTLVGWLIPGDPTQTYEHLNLKSQTTTSFYFKQYDSYKLKWEAKGYAKETPDSEKIYRYICVANSVKTPVEVNIDNVITDLNEIRSDIQNVATRPYVVEMGENSAGWWKILSNGWVEQGGTVGESTTSGYPKYTVPLPIEMASLNFKVQVTGKYTTNTGDGTNYCYSKTTTSISIVSVGYGSYWEVKGWKA